MPLSDAHTRECLAIHVDQGIRGEQVVAVMECLLCARARAPSRIRVDNGLRIQLARAGPLGLPERGNAKPLAAGQADRQRLRGVVQRAIPRRVPEHALVLVFGRWQEQNRSVEDGLQ